MSYRPRKHHLFGALVVSALVIAGYLFVSSQYARAANITWDGGGGDNNWSTDENWSGDSAPGTGDVAVFDGTSTKDVTIDANVTVGGIDINSGYTGTMTQGTGNTLTVGASGENASFDISDGTFTGGNAAIDVNGSLTISGGAFTSTSDELQIANTMTVSSGTFTHNSGTVVANGGNTRTWSVDGETFSSFTLDKNNSLSFASDTINVAGDLTFTNGYVSSGTISWMGTTGSQSNGADGTTQSTGTLEFANDAAAQTFTIAGGNGPITMELDDPDDSNDSIVFTTEAPTYQKINIATGFTSGTCDGSCSTTIPITNGSDLTLHWMYWTQSEGVIDVSTQTEWEFVEFDNIGGTFTGPVTSEAVENNVRTWTLTGTHTFDGFTLNKGNALVLSGGDLNVTGDLTLTDGYVSSGTINWTGTTGSQGSGADGTTQSTGTLEFANDAAAQTFTIAGGNGPITMELDDPDDSNDSITYTTTDPGYQKINIASGFTSGTCDGSCSTTIPITNGSDLTLHWMYWTQAEGVIDASAQSDWEFVEFDQTGGTFTGPATATAVEGNNRTWTLTGTHTFDNFTLNKPGPYVDLASGTLNVTGDLTITDGYFISGTINWTGTTGSQGAAADSTTQNNTATLEFANDAAAQTFTVSGGNGPVTFEFDDPDDSNDSLVYTTTNPTYQKINIATGFTSGTCDGTCSTTIPITNGSDLTLQWMYWTQAEGVIDASSQTEWELIEFDQTGGTFTGPVTSEAIEGNHRTWTLSGGTNTFDNFTLNKNASLTFSGGDLNVTGDLTITNGYVAGGTIVWTGTTGSQGSAADATTQSTGTLEFANDAAAQTFTVTGGLGPITFEFDDPDDSNDSLVYTTSNPTYQKINIASGFTSGTCDGSCSTTIPITNGSDLTLHWMQWTQAEGVIDASAQTAWEFLEFDQTGGTFTGPITTTISEGNHRTWTLSGTHTFNNVILSKGGGSINLSAGTLNIDGDTTLTSGYFGNGELDVAGDVTVTSGYTTSNSSPFNFSGGSTQTFDLTGATDRINADVTVNKSGGQVTLLSDLDLDATNGDLIIEEGEFDLQGQDLTVNGTSGTFIVEDGGTFTRFGDETISVNGGYPQYDSGSTVKYTGDGDAASDTYSVSTTYHHLTIDSTDGATDTFELAEAADVNGDLTITAGTFDVSASNLAVNVAGDWNNEGTFTARSGTVTLDGTGQSITGSTTFNNFTKNVAAADTLTFEASERQTFTGAFDVQGASGQLLSLRSSSDGVQTEIDPQGSRTTTYLDVKDNNNVHATGMNCSTGCVNSGNNTNWFGSLTVSTISGNTTEAGGQATFTVVLNTQPSDDVTFSVVSSDTGEGTVDKASLTFTNGDWDTPQTVTVTGVNDDVDDGDVVFTIQNGTTSSSDGNYNNIDVSDVSVTNEDNDTAGITVGTISGNTTEDGGTATFTVVLDTEPTNDVSIDLSSNNTDEGTVSPSTLTFTDGDWDSAQTVTVTGVDDLVIDGDVAYTIVLDPASSSDGNYNGVDPDDVGVTNTDNDALPSGEDSDTPTNVSISFSNIEACSPNAFVKLHLRASTTAEVLISNYQSFPGAEWQPFIAEETIPIERGPDDRDIETMILDWKLDPSVQGQPVFVKFRSFTGNSVFLSERAHLDLVPDCGTQLPENEEKEEEDSGGNEDGGAETPEPPPTLEVDDPSTLNVGDIVVGASFNTIYILNENLHRQPFYNDEVFFTYEDSFDVIKTISNALLATIPMAAPKLPPPEVILVKVESLPTVFYVQELEDEGLLLREIPDEETALQHFGPLWKDLILELPPTVWELYDIGDEFGSEDELSDEDQEVLELLYQAHQEERLTNLFQASLFGRFGVEKR